jgi:NAD(P)-dependent dehydrogenase (short-subunit alcohol dehydrogenase family)
MSFELKGARILVTGGTSGIGLASATAFAKYGVSRIGLVGRDVERGTAAAARVAEHCGDVTFHSCDTLDRASVERTVSQFGRVDVLLNCAGVGGHHAPLPFLDQDPAEFRSVLDTSLLGILYFCRAVLPGMRDQGQGVILNTGSDAGKVPTPGETVIGGMMAAVAMFSRGLAMEVSRHNIRVHGLSPSIVQNTRSYDMVMGQEFSRKLFAKAEGRARLGVVQPEDLAELAVFLASPAAARMTGQVISVNGGISAG